MEIIDLLLKPPPIPQIMAILSDMSRDLSKALKYKFYFKRFRMLKPNCVLGSISIHVFRNITNKLFLPVKGFEVRRVSFIGRVAYE